MFGSGLVRLRCINDTLPGADSPLIGRDAELQSLDDFEMGARQREEGVGCIVVGAAGMGKSHLAGVFAARLQGKRRYLCGRAASYGEEAFTPFAEILREASGIEPSATTAEARGLLSRFLTHLDARSTEKLTSLDVVSIDHLLDDRLEGPSLSDGIEPLMALMGYPVSGEGLSTHDIAASFLAVMRALSLREPLCLILEDIHWLPSAGQTVINELVSWGRDDNIFLLMTARPGVLQSLENGSAHVHRMDLAPLKRGASEELIRQLQPQLTEPGLSDLVSRAEGNPLYLRELAIAAKGTQSDELPPTIEGVIQARADRISHADRELLQIASVLGREFVLEGVERLSQRPDQVALALGRLERGRFIRRRSPQDESSFVFEHGLLHEVVYRGVPL